jgi:predicted XRE-type DNA-binding protein
MKKISHHPGSGNVFADLGFSPAAAAELTVKSTLITTIADTIKARELTQQQAAALCGTDQPTLSKVLRGRMESVTIDRLAAWLNALGRTVEIHVRPYDRKETAGQLVISPGVEQTTGSATPLPKPSPAGAPV